MKAIYYLGIQGSKPALQLFADSAIGRDVMPLFVPEGFEDLRLSVCVAFRIGRLGKSITPKFASRYVDAISLVGVLHSAQASALMSITDGAVTTGKWIDCDLATMTPVTMEINGSEHTFDISSLAIAEAVGAVSAYATLKTGDFIILDSSASSFAVMPDGEGWKVHSPVSDLQDDASQLFCSLQGAPVLHLRLK